MFRIQVQCLLSPRTLGAVVTPEVQVLVEAKGRSSKFEIYFVISLLG